MPTPPPLKRRGLFLCEAEIASQLSQSERHWRAVVRQLERDGPPKIDKLMGGRYWPVVTAFFDRRYGLDKIGTDQPILADADVDGEEHWDHDAA